MEIRETKIEIYKRIGVDKDTHGILRRQKKVQKKSMAEIVCETIKLYFGNKK